MSEQEMRLSKRMVELGLCSRREADAFIEQGRVRVDGQLVQQLGSRVRPEQRIELDKPRMTLGELSISLLLHRAATEPLPLAALITPDNHAAADGSELVFNPRHLKPLQQAGALEPGCHGLVALTLDKKLARKLADAEQEYLVQLEAAPSAEQLKQRLQQLQLPGKAPRGLKVSRQSDRQLRLVLTAAQPGQLAAICQGLALQPLALRCIRIGKLGVGNLPAGQWRYLLPMESF
ncbi:MULTISPECIES: RNA pseudouridine synthase [Aquitalea]|uniref:Dual-specificity RNA pseudouridine synthase RluF n=1 Tax=Aquitalea magnusonii TaxID=332411 RepID=A0A318J555_9NEIS|nr:MULTISPECIES: RNA pseudouridine synthase [Aquitalea]PXX41770.1 16S rRNA U516 pseudouridylate synthase RsuA-like enzyme [Aquitalea magnusonii]